jgi:hypothetical protein
LFALSPLPSAQLFETAGLIGVALVPLTAVFFVGRLVSYGLYVGGSAAAKTGAGRPVTSSFTSPWAISFQLLLLLGLVGRSRIDWAGMHQRHEDRRNARSAGPSASGER